MPKAATTALRPWPLSINRFITAVPPPWVKVIRETCRRQQKHSCEKSENCFLHILSLRLTQLDEHKTELLMTRDRPTNDCRKKVLKYERSRTDDARHMQLT